LLSLGFEEILRNPVNIVLIEWPELIKKHLPRDTRWITIEHPVKGAERKVTFMR
jgi:tRNA A37 threonylcarbamoyladenosine biosynthesis protein TsaE